VPPELSGVRLDQAVAALFGVSRGRARELIDNGAVFVAGRRVQRQSLPVTVGAVVSAAVAFEAPALDGLAARVLFTDDGLIAFDKPAGVPSVPTPAGAAGTLLVEARKAALVPFELTEVHRLDAATSGAIVFARPEWAEPLRAQFAQSAEAVAAGKKPAPHKFYLAQTVRPARFDGAGVRVLSSPVKPLREGRWGVATPDDPDGKPAITLAVPVSVRDESVDWLVAPLTGRTHQIRVHLAYAGIPILGDRYYAPRPTAAASPRLCLHAWRLVLKHPVRVAETVTITAPLPPPWADLLAPLALEQGLAALTRIDPGGAHATP
jgi:23S rRNA pseudouridine1911/1915/1917 synthase